MAGSAGLKRVSPTLTVHPPRAAVDARREQEIQGARCLDRSLK
jgi:hypothetical protein